MKRGRVNGRAAGRAPGRAPVHTRRKGGRWRLLLLALLLVLVACQTPSPEEETAPTPTFTLTPEIGLELRTRLPSTAVVVQTTPTPLPTPTETPTATPIVYQIVAGDTLLAIAIARQTTVSEILELNPTIRPESLQIGAPLILPPPATPIAQTVLGTPIPIQVSVMSVTLYRTPLDGLWILGQVRNDGEQPVENIQVEISLPDDAGEMAAVATAWALPAVLPPGETAPFGVLLPQAPLTIGLPVTAVTGGQTVTDIGSRYLDLATEATMITIEDSRLAVEGWIDNIGQETATQIVLIATFYDIQKRVTGYQVHYVNEILPPGGRLPFSLTAAPPGSQTVDYQLVAQGLVIEE
jgi:LysM repeat protein